MEIGTPRVAVQGRSDDFGANKSLSKRIRDARQVKGFTAAELAERAGASQVSIYYWESGRVRPRDTNLAALCKALKMPLRETMAMTSR